MTAHAQLWACCRVSVIDRVRSRLRARVRITVRVRVCPRRLQALTPHQSNCFPERLNGVHKGGCQSGLVFEFQGQTNVSVTLQGGHRNPLGQLQPGL